MAGNPQGGIERVRLSNPEDGQPPEIQVNGGPAQGPGRPPIRLNSRDERILIRLLIHCRKPFERITKAIENSGGPKRLCIRRILHGLTGAGPDSDTSLGQVRLIESGDRGFEEHEQSARTSDHLLCNRCGWTGQENIHSSHIDASENSASLQQALGSGSAICTSIENAGQSESMIAPPFDELHHGGMGLSPQTPSKPSATPESSESSFTPSSGEIEHGRRSFLRGQRLRRPRRRDRLVNIDSTAFLQELDKGEAGECHHFANCCSISKSTIFSRMSSMQSECPVRTEGSDFVRYYAKPVPDNHIANSGSLLIDLLLQAKLENLDDKRVEDEIHKIFPSDGESALTTIVGCTDEQGVTALHLAVAYGLPRVCGLLMRNGADPFARTEDNICINHFAKPAEKHAADTAHYYRIKHCRRHVKKNIIPPVPNPRLRPKRRRQTSQPRPPRNPPQASTRAPTAPTTTTYSYMTGIDYGICDFTGAGPQILGGFTSSPAATLHSNPSVTDFQDFALPMDITADIPAHCTDGQTLRMDPNLACTMNGMVPVDLDPITHPGAPEFYYHCIHGLPRNYRTSHCRICPRLVWMDPC